VFTSLLSVTSECTNEQTDSLRTTALSCQSGLAAA